MPIKIHIATFNPENLDEKPGQKLTLDERHPAGRSRHGIQAQRVGRVSAVPGWSCSRLNSVHARRISASKWTTQIGWVFASERV